MTKKALAACKPSGEWAGVQSYTIRWQRKGHLDRGIGQIRPSEENTTRKGHLISPSFSCIKMLCGRCVHRLAWLRSSFFQYFSQTRHSGQISFSSPLAYSDCCSPQLEEQSQGQTMMWDLGTWEERKNDQLTNYYTGHVDSPVDIIWGT